MSNKKAEERIRCLCKGAIGVSMLGLVVTYTLLVHQIVFSINTENLKYIFCNLFGLSC